MNYLKRSLGNAWDFLKGTQAYFRDVLLMHGFILFICLPLLSSTTRFILHRGAIDYLSYDNIPSIFLNILEFYFVNRSFDDDFTVSLFRIYFSFDECLFY